MLKKIGIIGAMGIEVKFLLSQLEPEPGESSPRKTAAGGMSFAEGRISGVSVVIVQSGVGKVNAALCAQRLIIQFNVTHIINTGIAGAVAHGLNVFDFVVSTDALYHDMDASGFGYKAGEIPQMECSDFPADKAMAEAAQSVFESLPEFHNHSLVLGRIASGDQFISSTDAKARIARLFAPACVEMEGAAVAHVCYVNSIPFVIVRCISDTADDGGEAMYSFNEEEAAALSGRLAVSLLGRFKISN